jgi:hypothetical protein
VLSGALIKMPGGTIAGGLRVKVRRSSPCRGGFGSRMTEATVRRQLGGMALGTRLICNVEVPLTRVAASLSTSVGHDLTS